MKKNDYLNKKEFYVWLFSEIAILIDMVQLDHMDMNTIEDRIMSQSEFKDMAFYINKNDLLDKETLNYLIDLKIFSKHQDGLYKLKMTLEATQVINQIKNKYEDYYIRITKRLINTLMWIIIGNTYNNYFNNEFSKKIIYQISDGIYELKNDHQIITDGDIGIINYPRDNQNLATLIITDSTWVSNQNFNPTYGESFEILSTQRSDARKISDNLKSSSFDFKTNNNDIFDPSFKLQIKNAFCKIEKEENILTTKNKALNYLSQNIGPIIKEKDGVQLLTFEIFQLIDEFDKIYPWLGATNLLPLPKLALINGRKLSLKNKENL